MSTAAVATIACLALVGAAGLAVWVALQQRRADETARALTARKWDIVTLRAEVGALRQQMRDAGLPAAPPDEAGTDRRAGPDDHVREDDHSRGREPAPRSPAGVPRGPTGSAQSPTAWRRDRARGASSRPRRRRLF